MSAVMYLSDLVDAAPRAPRKRASRPKPEPMQPAQPVQAGHRGEHEPQGFAKLSPEQRKANARVGGLMLAATHDMNAVAAHARRGLWESYLRKADPDNKLPEKERVRRAEALRKAHYAKMSLARWGKA